MSNRNTDRDRSPDGDDGESDRAITPRRAVLRGVGALSVPGLFGATGGAVTSSRTDDEPGVVPQLDHPTPASPELEKWVDEVPRPDVIEPVGTRDGQPYYEVEIREVEQEVHRDLPPTTVWGYDGQYPGPTIEATRGEPIYVRWQSDLPDEHLLPVDSTIHADRVPYDTTSSRVVTHLHGGNVEHESDGKPLAWFTKDFEETGPAFAKRDYYYVNDQPPATLWYHDHSLGITRLNVYAGLAGFYILRDESEEDLGLPSGDYEIPLVLQDRTFDDDGSLYYPTGPSSEDGDDSLPETSIVPQFYGDTSVVNGTAWPRLTVEPRKYRFRLLNGSNSRFYDLELLEYDESDGTTGGDGPPFTLIGNDGGFLSEPLQFDGRLELGSGKRADVVVDFADYAGETLLLHNDAPAMYEGADGDDAEATEPLPEVLLVDVEDAETVEDPSRVPGSLGAVPEIPVDAADRTRYVTLARQTDDYGRPEHLLGTGDDITGYRLFDPATETPTLGTTEIWSIANITGMSHPVHLHLVHFQVLGSQPFSEFDPDADAVDPESLEPPAKYEAGWNDVVTVDPGEVTHVVVHFGEYEGLFNDQTGEYMWHCHMLEHEDHDMMRPMEVLPDSDDGDDPDDGDGDDPDGGDDGPKCEWPVDDENRDDGGPILE